MRRLGADTADSTNGFATLYGPIVVGEGTKIMAGCVLSRSVPARSIVEAPVPQVGARAPVRPRNRV